MEKKKITIEVEPATAVCKPSVKEEVEYKTDDIHILSLAKYG